MSERDAVSTPEDVPTRTLPSAVRADEHEDISVMRTLEAMDLEKTLVKRVNDTIAPRHHASTGGKLALEALRSVAAKLDGRISLERTLGEGGMGVVHLATQATLGRHVAVKTLRSKAGDVDATLRILREAWVTGALEHPNVVPVYDVGVDEQGSPVIVMKRVEGHSWAELLNDPEELTRVFRVKDPLEASLRVLIQVSNAIAFAHSRGILHRDIKPENVMIGAFGEVYVLDWGIAVSLRDDPSGRLPPLSQATEIAGTPSYMAPEMMHGDPSKLSPRTDVYLLGAVLFEIFAGAAPHHGSTTHAVVANILLSQPTYPENFPAEARRICEKAMNREPEKRFESVEAFRGALEDYLAHRGSRRLAHDAKKSLDALLEALADTKVLEAGDDEAAEERALRVFNLLGECRFGYRAALSAWPGNVAARRGLDRALLAVVESELVSGDPHAAATLLREVEERPSQIAARVEAALRARADEDKRHQKLDADLDPTVGSRTRSFIGAIFGALWTLTPLATWCLASRGMPITHAGNIGASAFYLLMGLAFRAWSRETMTKTLLNRRVAQSLGIHLVLQIVLAAGAWRLGISPVASITLLVFTWALSYSLIAIWVDRWFSACAVACTLAFAVACEFPQWLYLAMALANVVFMIVLLRVWLPKQDLEAIRRRRREVHRRARRVLFQQRDSSV